MTDLAMPAYPFTAAQNASDATQFDPKTSNGTYYASGPSNGTYYASGSFWTIFMPTSSCASSTKLLDIM